MRRARLPLLGLILLPACLPCPIGRAAGTADDAKPTGDPVAPRSAFRAAGRSEVALEETKAGWVAEVTINGTGGLRFLVDTASYTMVDEQVARAHRWAVIPM